MRLLVALAAGIILAAAPAICPARGTGGHSAHSSSSYSAPSSSSTSGHHRKTYSSLAERDEHGRIARSAKAKDEFKHSHPCPATGKSYGACPGYVIDHVTPLKRGGADAPSNMQWQTKAEATAKDHWE